MSSFLKKLKSLASPSLKRKNSKSNQSLSSLNTSSSALTYNVREKDLPKLHLAAWKGDLDKCKSYAKADKINALDREGRTALHLATDAGHIEVVRFLCAEGADLLKRDREKRTSFFIAVINGNLDLIILIYETLKPNQASISMTDVDNSTALHYASACKNISIMRFLLDTKQFSINVPDKNNYTPLHIAVHSKNYEIMKLLIENNAQIDVTDERGRTPLILAVMQSDTVSMKILLDAGCQKFVRDDEDKSAEDYAKGKVDLLDLLKGGKIQSKSFTTQDTSKKSSLSKMQSLSFSENSQLFKPAKQKSIDFDRETPRETTDLDAKFNNIDTWNDSDEEHESMIVDAEPPKIPDDENEENAFGQIIHSSFTHQEQEEENDDEENVIQNPILQANRRTHQEDNSESWMDETDSYLKKFKKQEDKKASFNPVASSKSHDGSWLILVYTSNTHNASTNCKVFIQVFGTKGNTSRIQLEDDSKESLFVQGNVDKFIVVLPSIGNPNKLLIGHDNSGSDASWHCEKVILKHLKTQEEFVFNCNRWIKNEVELQIQTTFNNHDSWNSSEGEDEDSYQQQTHQQNTPQHKKASNFTNSAKLNEIYEDIINETQTSSQATTKTTSFAQLTSNKKVNYEQENLHKNERDSNFHVIDFLIESYDVYEQQNPSQITDLIRLGEQKQNTSLINNTMNLIKDSSTHIINADLSNLSNMDQNDSTRFKSENMNEQQPPQISDFEEDSDAVNPMTTFANLIVSSNRQQVQQQQQQAFKLNEFTDDLVDLDYVISSTTIKTPSKKTKSLIKKQSSLDLIPDRPHHGISNASEDESSFEDGDNDDENEDDDGYRQANLSFPLPSAQADKSSFFGDSNQSKDDVLVDLILHPQLEKSSPKKDQPGLKELISGLNNTSPIQANQHAKEESKSVLDGLVFKVNKENPQSDASSGLVLDKVKKFEKLNDTSQSNLEPFNVLSSLVGGSLNKSFQKLDDSHVDDSAPKNEIKKSNQYVDILLNNAFNKNNQLSSESESISKKSTQHIDVLMNSAFSKQQKSFHDSPLMTPRSTTNRSSFSQLNDRISQNLMRRDSDKFNNQILINSALKRQDDSDNDQNDDLSSTAPIEPPQFFNDSSKSLENMNRQLEEALSARRDLELELRKSSAKVLGLDVGLKKTKELLNKIEKFKQDAELSLEKSQAQINTQKAEIQELRCELNELKDTKESLEHELSYVKRQQIDINDDDQNHDLTHENEKLKIEIEILTQKIGELKQDRNQLSLLRDDLTQQLEKTQLQVENRQEALEKALIQFNIEKTLLKDENLKFKNDLVEIGKNKSQLQLQVDAIKQEQIANKREQDKLLKEKFELELYSNQYQSNYQSAKLKYDSDIESYKKQQLELLEKQSLLEARLISSENEAKYNKDLVNEKQIQFEKCVEELQKAKSDLHEQQNQVGKEKDEKLRLQAQNDTIKERLQQIIEENITLKKKQEELVNTHTLERAHTSSILEIEKKKTSSELEVNFLKRDLDMMKQKLHQTENELTLAKQHQKVSLDESFTSQKRQQHTEPHYHQQQQQQQTTSAYLEESKILKQEVDKLKMDFNKIMNMYELGSYASAPSDYYPSMNNRFKMDVPSLITNQKPSYSRSTTEPIHHNRTAIIVPNCEIILTRHENDSYLNMLRNELSKTIELEVAKERPLLNLNTTKSSYDTIFERTMNSTSGRGTSTTTTMDLINSLRSKYII